MQQRCQRFGCQEIANILPRVISRGIQWADFRCETNITAIESNQCFKRKQFFTKKHQGNCANFAIILRKNICERSKVSKAFQKEIKKNKNYISMKLDSQVIFINFLTFVVGRTLINNGWMLFYKLKQITSLLQFSKWVYYQMPKQESSRTKNLFRFE